MVFIANWKSRRESLIFWNFKGAFWNYKNHQGIKYLSLIYLLLPQLLQAILLVPRKWFQLTTAQPLSPWTAMRPPRPTVWPLLWCLNPTALSRRVTLFGKGNWRFCHWMSGHVSIVGGGTANTILSRLSSAASFLLMERTIMSTTFTTPNVRIVFNSVLFIYCN